jgi:hypothetical protein
VSARRGSTNTFTQTPARLLARPSRVCVPITIAIACSDTTGGLRPPLLCCNANVRRRKNDICDAHTHIRPGAAGVSPPWISNSGGIVNVYHGGLTPTAPGCATCVRRAKAPFAMHKRTFSGAAGVRSSCAVLRAVTRATDGVPDRKAVIERASRPG